MPYEFCTNAARTHRALPYASGCAPLGLWFPRIFIGDVFGLLIFYAFSYAQ